MRSLRLKNIKIAAKYIMKYLAIEWDLKYNTIGFT